MARKSALESEISSTLKAFYCTLCDKQFKNVAQYDEHTNSYAHHHKARFKDMQANVRLKPKEEVDKRKEKERKREEKELRKMAAANGIRMAKPSTALSAVMDAGPSTSPTVDAALVPLKKSGWASVATGELTSVPAAPTAGWSAIGSASALNPSSSNLNIPYSTSSSAGPAFRTAGYTSLDTNGSPAPPPPPPDHQQLPPPPPYDGMPNIRTHNANSNDGLSSPRGSWSGPALPPVPPPPPPSVIPAPVPPVAQPLRSGWQQFQKVGVRKR